MARQKRFSSRAVALWNAMTGSGAAGYWQFGKCHICLRHRREDGGPLYVKGRSLESLICFDCFKARGNKFPGRRLTKITPGAFPEGDKDAYYANRTVNYRKRRRKR